LKLTIRDLHELAEPIKTIVDLHRGDGPLSKLKRTLVEHEGTRSQETKAQSPERYSRGYIYGAANFDFPLTTAPRIGASTVERSNKQSRTIWSNSFHPDSSATSISLTNSIAGQPDGDGPVLQEEKESIRPLAGSEYLYGMERQEYFLTEASKQPYSDSLEKMDFATEPILSSNYEQQSRQPAQSFGREKESVQRLPHNRPEHASEAGHVGMAPIAKPIERWAEEYAPEERMRLGLPRW
jgi:hypothetical protein